jgi:hypothetical protein
VDKIYPNPYDPGLSDIKLGISLNRNARWFGLKIYTVGFRFVRSIALSGIPDEGKGILSISRVNFAALSSGTYYYILSAISDDGATAVSKPGYILIFNR